MRIMVLGCDGYLGHPTCLYLQAKGHDVFGIDDLSKRDLEAELDISPLVPVSRCKLRGGYPNLLANIRSETARNAIKDWKPDAIIHYAEQPSAPYSMIGVKECDQTIVNNISGTASVLWAIKGTDTHLIKLGTMGEYGTPNIDIEEGWLDVTHNGRTDKVLYPKRPGSFYHASKVADSTFIEFACRTWNIRATDLNQGVVYGYKTDEMRDDSDIAFHYDAVFGTALNRFVAQAVKGEPITVYGSGGQIRGWLDIRDTLRCVELACLNPAQPGEFRVFNQFTQLYSVDQLAQMVSRATDSRIEYIDNPRVEAETHYYNPKNSGLISLGLKPNLLTQDYISEMASFVEKYKEGIDASTLLPNVRWK